MTHGSLFAGIGGFDLGFERAGIKTIWQVEINEFCRKILERHFPDAKRFGDIRECGKHNLESVDIISGGFPCQDISRAGLMAGIEGERSGLWKEYHRIICELRPRYAVVENVPGLLDGGLGRVLGDLAEIGYDTEWDCISAASFGAPHIRERVWILTYPRQESGRDEGRNNPESGCKNVLPEGDRDRPQAEWCDDRELVALVPGIHQRSSADWWLRQSRMARSVNGVPRELVDEQNGSFGNAVVPQIAEWLGQRILEAERKIRGRRDGCE